MFVLTIDQVNSRSTLDAVGSALTSIIEQFGDRVLLGPDRTAGDEFQVVVDSAATTLDVILFLHRLKRWSVGLGIGRVATPLPESTREARGSAFPAAREAIGVAKTHASRLAVRAPEAAVAIDAAGVSALLDLLLDVRARRSREGWEVADLAETGLTQVAIAGRLRITPQAVSLRARAASVREDRAARPAIITLLAALDAAGDGDARAENAAVGAAI